MYKLTIHGSTTILGLMWLTDPAEEGFDAFEIKLLEVANEHVGNGKKLDRVAGCLIAFAGRQSFKYGYDGFIFLKSKTSLAQHYSKKYGFTKVGFHMASDTLNSMRLIASYLEAWRD